MRHYNPEKVELLGRAEHSVDEPTYLGHYSLWYKVAVLGDGKNYFAVDITVGDDYRTTQSIILSGRYPYVRYYRIPAKYAEIFAE